ncbi:MAG: 2,3-bisphosphoglycerate-independent phosphoglycerate mutase [Anaerolineales bacterium]|nr:2,3-bisphosphoglycerate-independent phosphoglycerate mutase [Anaerolineales bacterium]
MPYSYLKPLLDNNGSKIILLLLDGLGGIALTPDGKSALEYAKTPNLDRLAEEGTLGQTIPIRYGITPGSGPAHLALFGYEPLEFVIGRGALSAAGINLPVKAGDIAARGNLCTFDENRNVIDRRAGRISQPEAAPVIELLNQVQIPEVEVEVRQVKEYRFVVVMRGEGLNPSLNDTDPQEVGVPPLKLEAQDPDSKKSAELMNKWIEKAYQALADQPVANGFLLRGFATDPGLPSYEDAYELEAVCIAEYPMYKGVSRLVGMDVIEGIDSGVLGEFNAAKEHWNKHDFFFIHIKKTDSYGEDGNLEAKAKIIEEVDQALPVLLDLNPDVLIITGDHSTPSVLKSHSWHPVPFLLWAPKTHRTDFETAFTERNCARGGLGTFPAVETMSLALAHAGRLQKFGA